MLELCDKSSALEQMVAPVLEQTRQRLLHFSSSLLGDDCHG